MEGEDLNRRSLLKYLLSTPLALTVDYEKLLWVPGKKKIFIPSTAQMNFIDNNLLMAIWGIPYHACELDTGTWLGIPRISYVNKEITSVIQVLEEDKKKK